MAAHPTLTIRVDPELRARIEARAKLEDRTVANYILRAVRIILDQTEGTPAEPAVTSVPVRKARKTA
jgi:hypothetical protein